MCARPRCSCQWAHRVRGCRRRRRRFYRRRLHLPPPAACQCAGQPGHLAILQLASFMPAPTTTPHILDAHRLTPPHSRQPLPPAYPPACPAGSVKGLTSWQLEELGCQVILGNTYHLENRPGSELVAEMGGLHGFINWQRGMLTDSGGFQVRQAGSRQRPPARTVFLVCLAAGPFLQPKLAFAAPPFAAPPFAAPRWPPTATARIWYAGQSCERARCFILAALQLMLTEGQKGMLSPLPSTADGVPSAPGRHYRGGGHIPVTFGWQAHATDAGALNSGGWRGGQQNAVGCGVPVRGSRGGRGRHRRAHSCCATTAMRSSWGSPPA
jgi:hypothetical protein